MVSNAKHLIGRRITFIEPIVTPYRIPLFNEMAKRFDDFHVVFRSARLPDGATWNSFLHNVEFRSGFLDKRILASDEASGGSLSSFSLPMKLGRQGVNTIICGGYDSLASVLGLFYTKLTGGIFVLATDSTSRSARRMSGPALRYKRWFVSASDAFVAYSKSAAAYLTELRAPARSVFLAPNATANDMIRSAVVQARSSDDSVRRELKIVNPVLLFVGRLVQEKGLTYLLSAFNEARKSLRNVHLVLVGDGPLRRELEHYCAVNSLDNVRFVGFVQPDQLPRYYAIADGLVLPSVRETWGFVVNEAMACGLPIIVTDQVGSANEIVLNTANGFVVPAADSYSLAVAIVKLLQNSITSAEMGQRSLEIISEYTIERAVDGFEAAIEFAVQHRQVFEA